MKEQVLAQLIRQNGAYISGEAVSEALGVSRAAVWKAIDALREEGYTVEAAPRRGYRLAGGPDRLSEGTVSPYLHRAAPLVCLETVDSTNNYAKTEAMRGAPDGAAFVANEQTGGRGRMGRSFLSPKDKGIYLSMLFRPEIPPARAVNLTAFAAVAVCEGVEAVCGARPGIKWTNDIILNGKKLCGILTEMSVEGETGALQYIVTGIGVNVNQSDFPQSLRGMATSLSMELGHEVPRGRLCAGIISAMDGMYHTWRRGGGDTLARYRARCVTLGREVRLLRGGTEKEAFAEEIDEDFGLIVRYPDGRRETVNTGEVSVRGLYGYHD